MGGVLCRAYVARSDPLVNDIGVSMVYLRRVVKRRPASLTEEEWLRLVSSPPVWPPAWDRPSADRPPDNLDRHVLCWWCREVHLASGVDSCMALPRKEDVGATRSKSCSSSPTSSLSGTFAELWGFLTVTSWEDGKRRLAGRISVSFASDGFTLALNDAETGQYACLTGMALDDLFLEAEQGLATGELPWRASKFASSKQRR